LRELAAIVDSSTSITNDEEVKNQTQAEGRSPLGLRELAAIVDSSTSITNDEEVKNQTQAEGRSPLGLRELANFLASEPDSDDSDSVNSQAAPEIETSRQPNQAPLGQGVGCGVWGVGEEIAPTHSGTQAPSFQDDGIGGGLELLPMPSSLHPLSHPQHPILDSSFESEGVVDYPASSQTVQHLKPFTSPQISKGDVLSESSFSQEQHQQNYLQENTTKHETNFFSQPVDQEIEIDLIFEAIAQEINREYRRFYGC
jgi:hypothetical protein